jgi:hypothetical protein
MIQTHPPARQTPNRLMGIGLSSQKFRSTAVSNGEAYTCAQSGMKSMSGHLSEPPRGTVLDEALSTYTAMPACVTSKS